jgi:alpha-ketoglutarate-dependent taurine dioxygenase
MFEIEHASPRVGSVIRTTKKHMLSGSYAEDIGHLLVERSALAFPGMFFTDEEQIEFASTIGEVFLVGAEEVQKISMDPEINPVADYTRGAFFWHIDGANDEVPAKATMLTAKVLADGPDGDTLVANTFAAYEDLPDQDKEMLTRMRARHALEATGRMVHPDPTSAQIRGWHSRPSRFHPIVWSHRSGQKSLLIGATAYYVEDMDIEQGRALLCRLQEFATQPQYVYRHKWSVGDFLLWDNTGTMHKAAPYPLNSRRLMHRTTLVGEESIA